MPGSDPDRITPAQAGKRKSATKETKGYEDHPRVGGEKQTFWKALATSLGSPPRRRGKGRRIVPNVEGLRITPAWAGKSRGTEGAWHVRQDHPRVGGEKFS